jgi:Tfp pilus assembly protein PilF
MVRARSHETWERWTIYVLSSTGLVVRPWVVVILCSTAPMGCRLSQWKSAPAVWRLNHSRDLADEGAAALSAGDPDLAEEKLRRAVRACPENDTARLQLAKLMADQGDLPSAIECLESVQRDGAMSAPLLESLLEFHRRAGNDAAVAVTARELIAMDGNSVAGLRETARQAELEGQWDLALVKYQRLLSEDPTDMEARLALVQVYLKRNEPLRALAVAGECTRGLSPEEGPQRLFLLQGVAYATLGDLQQAGVRLAEAERRGPPTGELYYHLARVEAARGRYQEADKHLRRAEQLAPRDRAIAALRAEFSNGARNRY